MSASKWCWYPLNRVQGVVKLLVMARVSEDEDEIASLVDVDGGTDDLVDYPGHFDNLDEDAQELLRAELLEVGTSAAHPNWVGFPALRDLAFPKRAAEPVKASTSPTEKEIEAVWDEFNVFRHSGLDMSNEKRLAAVIIQLREVANRPVAQEETPLAHRECHRCGHGWLHHSAGIGSGQPTEGCTKTGCSCEKYVDPDRAVLQEAGRPTTKGEALKRHEALGVPHPAFDTPAAGLFPVVWDSSQHKLFLHDGKEWLGTTREELFAFLRAKLGRA